MTLYNHRSYLSCPPLDFFAKASLSSLLVIIFPCVTVICLRQSHNFYYLIQLAPRPLRWYPITSHFRYHNHNRCKAQDAYYFITISTVCAISLSRDSRSAGVSTTSITSICAQHTALRDIIYKKEQFWWDMLARDIPHNNKRLLRHAMGTQTLDTALQVTPRIDITPHRAGTADETYCLR